MIEFKPLDEPHLEWARLLHNDPEVLSMLTDPHEVTAEEQVLWFNKLQQSKSSKRMMVFVNQSLVGLARLDQIDIANESICIGLDIDKAYRGQGLAKQIYKEGLKELFKSFNRVWLMVANYNPRALHIYKSVGFKLEGVQRQALLKNGVYHNYIMMAILRNEWSPQ